MKYFKILWNGILKENPTFVLLLGMCPTLGTTSSAINGMSMGLATMAVLIFSNLIISCIKNLIPDQVRIPSYIVVIASLVTALQMFMQAYTPEMYKTLGLFIPLIVVNCIILGRAEEHLRRRGYRTRLHHRTDATRWHPRNPGNRQTLRHRDLLGELWYAPLRSRTRCIHCTRLSHRNR